MHTFINASRPDGILRVLKPGRISTPNQRDEAIQAKNDTVEQWLRQRFDGEIEFKYVSQQVSGYSCQNEVYSQSLAFVCDQWPDLVVVTEIREIVREPSRQHTFINTCVDNDVRLISIRGALDTADPNWRQSACVGALLESMAPAEASERVKEMAAYSFKRGGMTLKVRFGYEKIPVNERVVEKNGDCVAIRKLT
ncbi:recombinase family protein [Stratiformator vulcanicus]|uniref:Resolvase/invertase-type recombinase catalytic domain-containing protein n=1 Tax=Stratiformator vulcanicus TaxID=2527980 RepID=A0A517QWD8_9PLAN|nr:recombinase family protein [Stratiformator vulcanicus]QDT35951.1 hypothetical protein Pan189_03060 [Stratiformator vulcanicus]